MCYEPNRKCRKAKNSPLRRAWEHWRHVCRLYRRGQCKHGTLQIVAQQLAKHAGHLLYVPAAD
jgi:hypothetical protein